MHPKQICLDVETMGSKVVLESDELYIDNPMNLYPEIEQIVKDYKNRIIKYLKGNYSDKDHSINQTVDKIINFYMCVDQGMNAKIGSWLISDDEAVKMLMELFVMFSNNGWFPPDPVANYQDSATDEVSKKLYERAMRYFKANK